MAMKVLKQGKDFRIIQRKEITEYFIWTCPYRYTIISAWIFLWYI